MTPSNPTMQKFMQKLKRGEKVTIVAMGDSITELTWHTRGRLNWVGLLQEALFETFGRNRCWVINSGRCGDTAENGLRRLDQDVLRFDPDLVIISYGMNDASGNEGLAAFRSSMKELIRRIRAHNRADVLLRTPNPIFNPPTAFVLDKDQPIGLEAKGARQGMYAREIVKIAQEENCAVVDHYSRWKELENLRGTMTEEPNHAYLYMSDPVHPGPQGHLAFYRQLAPLFDLPTHFPWEL